MKNLIGDFIAIRKRRREVRKYWKEIKRLKKKFGNGRFLIDAPIPAAVLTHPLHPQRKERSRNNDANESRIYLDDDRSGMYCTGIYECDCQGTSISRNGGGQ